MTNKRVCSCGMPQSYPIPHEHDMTEREKIILKAAREEVIDWVNLYKWRMADNFGKKDTMFGLNAFDWKSQCDRWLK